MEGYHNDLTKAGFTKHNTGGRQTRNLPNFFHLMAEASWSAEPK